MDRQLEQLEIEGFPMVYKIMEQSFPDCENRLYADAVKLLANPYYRIFVLRRNNGNIDAFVTSWEFATFRFVEHLAVNNNLRSAGLGSKIMKAYIKREDKPVYLEVEDLETQIAKRRIGFYERLGFVLNDFGYMQPPLQKTAIIYPLRIMSYPHKVTEEDFADIKKEIHLQVYGMKI